MKRKLPPLSSVVAFESAARLESFKDAADSLCVTSSAISHQVKALEQWLGCKLFERSTRSVQLTDAGRRFLFNSTEILDKLEVLTKSESCIAMEESTVKLQISDSFAAYWLVPKLPFFHEAYLNISVQIITYDYRDGFRNTETDMAILYKENSSQMNNECTIAKEEVFPVCSPKFFRQNKIHFNTDFAKLSLIHDDNLGVGWQDWVTRATPELGYDVKLNNLLGSRFCHSHLALKAAEQGNGLTLASAALVEAALTTNELIAPFKTTIETKYSYVLFQTKEAMNTKHCQCFFNWLKSYSLFPCA